MMPEVTRIEKVTSPKPIAHLAVQSVQVRCTARANTPQEVDSSEFDDAHVTSSHREGITMEGTKGVGGNDVLLHVYDSPHTLRL